MKNDLDETISVKDFTIELGRWSRWSPILLPVLLVPTAIFLVVFLIIEFSVALLASDTLRPSTETLSRFILVVVLVPVLINILFLGLIVAVGPFRRWLAIRIYSIIESSGGKDTSLSAFRIGGKIRAKLKALAADESVPLIICRNAVHTKHIYWLSLFRLSNHSFDPAKRIVESPNPPYLFDRLNDLLLAKYLEQMEAELRPDRDQGKYFGDAITQWESENSVVQTRDLPLYYTQATPYRRFPRTGDHIGERPKAKYVVFSCLTNPINDPVWVLPTNFIVNQLRQLYPDDSDWLIEELEKHQFHFFMRYSHSELNDEVFTKQHDVAPRPILMQVDDKFQSGFDINRLDLSRLDQFPRARMAVFAWHQAIQHSSKNALKVELKAGDVLFVKNYWAFYRRKELKYSTIAKPTLLPLRRWLRIYWAHTIAPNNATYFERKPRSNVDMSEIDQNKGEKHTGQVHQAALHDDFV